MTMIISSTYICPARGIAGLEPPEPTRLEASAKVAMGLGVKRLMLPVLEESLAAPPKILVRYLDGLIQALDHVHDTGLQVWIIAPAQSLLGLRCMPPYLVSSRQDQKPDPIFVDRKVRYLRDFDWWGDPSILQKRIRVFHELVGAVSGHPSLTGWLILERFLEWPRPELNQADVVLKAFVAEIRERDESVTIFLGMGWPELLNPETAKALACQVDGVSIRGTDKKPPYLTSPAGLAGELLMASYWTAMAGWLLERPTTIEIGWGMPEHVYDAEEIKVGFKQLAGQGPAGADWISLIDPEPPLRSHPPWILRPGHESIALLDYGMEPKEGVETWLEHIETMEARHDPYDFIDISREEYLIGPTTHLTRLWEHFRESRS
jgi:hypothetical protein